VLGIRLIQKSLTSIKRILKYVKGTQNLELWYGHQSTFDLIGFTDADFVGDRMDRKSTRGTYQFLGDYSCYGRVTNRLQWPFLRPKLSMLRPVVVAHNCFG
jgi:hypothetical protein